MPYNYVTADIFTDALFGGNPLAVFHDARGLSSEEMAVIARELNLSETTFVLPPDDPKHTRRVRIFTPGGELPFAGHPTVGTAFVLATLGEIKLGGDETNVVFEEGVGPVPVRITSRNGAPGFCQLSVAKLPEAGPPAPSRATLAEILSLDTNDVLGGTSSPQAFSCGLPFLFVPLRDRDAIARVRVRPDKWEETLKNGWARDVMVFSRDPEREGSHIRARVFVPSQSIIEDPATGSAAAALAGYLGQRETAESGTFRCVIEQGFEMGRPSIIELEYEKRDGAVTAVRVGGKSVMVSSGTMRAREEDHG